MELEFEIFFTETRRNTGNGRTSVFRVHATQRGRKSPWRDQTFTEGERRRAIDYFNLLRRTLNARDDQSGKGLSPEHPEITETRV